MAKFFSWGVAAIVLFAIGAWWYSPENVCDRMIQSNWYGDPELCVGHFKSGFQPCFDEDTRTSAYCHWEEDAVYKVYDAAESLPNGQLTFIGVRHPNDVSLGCGSTNIFCNLRWLFW